MTLGRITAELDGVLTENPQFVGSQVKYRFFGPHVADILRLLDRPPLIEDSFVLEGNVKRTQAGLNIDQSSLLFGESELEVNGVIGDDPLRRDSNLSLRYRGPHIDEFAVIAGYTGFMPGGNTTIIANLQAKPDGIHLGKLEVKIGQNQLQGSGLISLQDGLTGSRVNVSITGADIAKVLPDKLLEYVTAEQSFELSSALTTSSGQLAIDSLDARLGEVRLQASGSVSMEQPLDNSRMKFDLKGPNLAAIVPQQLVEADLPQAEFSVNGSVEFDQGGLVLDTVKVAVGANQLQLSGTIPVETPTDGLELTIAAKGPNLHQLLPIEPEQFDIRDLAFDI